MKYIRLFLAVLLFPVLAPIANADVPPPERLVSRNAAFVLTVPDWNAAVEAFEKTSTASLLKDPAMKPLLDRIAKDILESLHTATEADKELVEKFLPLIQGQVTIVLEDLRDIAENLDAPPLIFIFDVKDKQAELQEFIALASKGDGELQVLREKVAGGELITTFAKVKGRPDKPLKMYVAVLGSMLGVSPKKENILDLIRRKNGDLQNSLADNPTFRSDHARFFRNAKGYLWINVEEIIKLAKANIEAPKAGGGNPFTMALDVNRLLNALGLEGWKSMAFATDYDSRGSDLQMYFNVPESGRKGLFKLLETEHRSSAPPSFVGDDVAHFVRWRKSGEEALQILEKTLAEAMPMAAGFLTMMIDQVGKMKNPDFDFRRQFIGNLGDDIMTIQMTPKEFTLDALVAPPTLYLIGSGNPDALLDATMTAQSSMGIPGMDAKGEDFLGKQIYAMSAGVKLGVGGKPAGQRHLFATTARGYMAIGTERELIEDFIRGGGAANKLSEINGFRQAVEKVGGLGTGWFFYDNPLDMLNMLLTSFKQNPNALESLFGPVFFKAILINPNSSTGSDPGMTIQQRMTEYIALLPDFKQIAKYMSFSVGSAMTDADGILIRAYSPDHANQ